MKKLILAFGAAAVMVGLAPVAMELLLMPV